MSRSPDAHGAVRLAIHAPRDLADAFERVERAEERTISAAIRRLMALRVREAEGPEDEGPAHQPTPVTTPAAGPAGNVQPTR